MVQFARVKFLTIPADQLLLNQLGFEMSHMDKTRGSVENKYLCFDLQIGFSSCLQIVVKDIGSHQFTILLLAEILFYLFPAHDQIPKQ